MIYPEIYDVIELLVDLPEHNLRAGTRGTLLHQHTEDVYEVEFTDEEGETLALCAVPKQQFIVVWKANPNQPVSVAEQIGQIIARLPEKAGVEILDFARFLSVRLDQLSSDK
jgi:hypothetical protein